MARARDEEATLADENMDHLVLTSLEDVSELIDPRLTPADRPDNEVLDEGIAQQIGDLVHHRNHHLHKESTHEKSEELSEEPLYVSSRRATKRSRQFLSGAETGDFIDGVYVFCPGRIFIFATIGISIYALGFGVVPLVTASFSEEFGRQPLYLCSGIGFLLFTIATAVGKNIQTVLVARFFAGAFGSTGSTMVGGTVADIFAPHERGVAMASFAAAAIGATGVGCLSAGWIEQNHHLEWRWIQWIHAIFSGVFVIAVPIFMKETRTSVLLVRLAKKMRKETGNHKIRARIEDERASLSTLIYISCTRPLYLLVTEPVIASFTLWVGFAWGILYVMIESIGPVFQKLHNFNSGEEGTVFICVTIGSLLGLCSNVYQEKLYSKNVGVRGPEARLYAPMAAAIIFPAGMFIYAWSTYTKVYWISLAIGIVLIMWALFIIYLAVFTYLADCYGPWASSALAGQSLFRNIMGMAFPLFTTQMFSRLTYHWGNTLFALIAVAMIPIPYVLYFKGPVIRAKSKFASRAM